MTSVINYANITNILSNMKIKTAKITDSHSSLTSAAAEVLGLAEKRPEVSKIGIGYIAHVRGGRRDLKFLPITGGIKAMVRGSGAVQELYIYTATPEETEKYLIENFNISL